MNGDWAVDGNRIAVRKREPRDIGVAAMLVVVGNYPKEIQ